MSFPVTRIAYFSLQFFSLDIMFAERRYHRGLFIHTPFRDPLVWKFGEANLVGYAPTEKQLRGRPSHTRWTYLRLGLLAASWYGASRTIRGRYKQWSISRPHWTFGPSTSAKGKIAWKWMVEMQYIYFFYMPTMTLKN